jgi:outer membrane autotransporter protein
LSGALSRTLLVGTMVQFDSMRQRSNLQTSDVSGQGWLAGPYATLRLTDNVFWQARAAWGQSSNEVSPFQTYTDEFDTDRWLISSTLTGRWGMGPWVFRPSASVAYIEDVAKSYADTFGVVVPEVKSRLGQAKAGPDIGYRYQFTRDVVIEPHAGLQVIWNFAVDTTATGLGQINGEDAGPAGVRGRAEIGLRAITSNGIGLDLSGSYDGVGAKDYDSFTGRAMVRVPLN